MMTESKGTVKKIKAVDEGARYFRKKMYADAHTAHEKGKKVAWNMFGSFADPILKAFDIVSIWNENYASICAAKKVQQPFLEVAEAEGYVLEICGYTRIGLGFSCLWQKQGEPPPAPEGGMPQPDLFITNSANCDPRQKFMQALQRYWDVPAFCLDVVWPPQGADLQAVKGYYIQYLTEELRSFVTFLEEHTRQKLDKDKLWYHIDRQNELMRVYYDIGQLRRAVPCPMGCLDAFPLVMPATFYSCEPESLEFLTRVRDEVRARVEKKTGAIEPEKYRLLWGLAPPPWYALPIFSYMESLGAVIIGEHGYYLGQPSDIRLPDPLETLAWRQWERFTAKYHNVSFPNIPRLDAQWIEEAKVDGLVLHINPSCRDGTANIYYRDEIERILQRKIPTIFIESDMIDARTYSEAEAKAKVDAFIEILAAAKQQRNSYAPGAE